MAKLSTEELIAAFKELTLVELSDFVKAFEEEFDVTAAAPTAVAVAAAPAGEAAAGTDADYRIRSRLVEVQEAGEVQRVVRFALQQIAQVELVATGSTCTDPPRHARPPGPHRAGAKYVWSGGGNVRA